MAESIGEVLTYAIGVAISPVPIIAVILMLFSARARVNGPMFLAGWALALAVVSGVAYLAADAGDAATDSTASDTVSWGKIAVGVALPPDRRTPVARPPRPGERSPRCRSGWPASTRSPRSSRSRSRCCSRA